MHNFRFILILSFFYSTNCFSQITSIGDPTADPNTSTTVPWNNGGYDHGRVYSRGPRNMVYNGNLNICRYNTSSYSCDHLDYAYPTTSIGWRPANNSDLVPISVPPLTGSQFDNIHWPYTMKWYCDVYDVNNLYASPMGAVMGAIEMEVLGNDNERNYLMLEMTKPLVNGKDYQFEISIAARRILDSANLAIDQIGALFIDTMPIPDQSGKISLENYNPQIKTPIGIPVDSMYRLTGTITGSGQKYLVIGCFEDTNNLTFSHTRDNNSFSANYMFDNVLVYDPLCTNDNVYLPSFADTITGCLGVEQSVTAQLGDAPYKWILDGVVLPETTISALVTPQAYPQLLQVVTGSGSCADTATAVLSAAFPESTMPDTVYQLCDDNVVIDYPFIEHHGTPGRQWTWYNLDSSITHYNYSNPEFQTADTGLYVLQYTYSNSCTLTDTVIVANLGEMQMEDPISGAPWIVQEIGNEHCFNMYDGFIKWHNIGHPDSVYFEWQNPLFPLAYNSIDSLTTGNYQYRIYDDAHHCIDIQDNILRTADSCSIIEGDVFLDKDLSCNFNLGDRSLGNITITSLPTGNIGVSDTNGHFRLFLPPGNHSFTRQNSNPLIANYCMENVINIPNAGVNYDTILFADTLREFNHNLEVTSLIAHPIKLITYHHAGFKIRISNVGDTVENAILKFHAVHPEMDIIEGNIPNFIGFSGDTLLISEMNIQPQAYRDIEIPYVVDNDFTTIGDVVTVYAEVQPNTVDSDQTNNTETTTTTVVSSYDPNDKQVSPKGEDTTHFTDVNEREFAYTVRFQNTGNAPAARVLVTDEISELLDITTFELVYNSHPVEVYSNNGTTISFDFQGIMLPDSNSNEPESHGLIQYKINAKTTATLGDQIDNTAFIYFDNNPAIITNTTTNIYHEPVISNIDFNSKLNSFIVYPNPAKNRLNILSEGVSFSDSPRLFDIAGNEIKVDVINKTNKSTEIDISNLSNGIYFIEIHSVNVRLKFVVN